MDSPFIEIGNIAALDEFLANVNGSAAVLFKHSNSCGVSARALAEMSKMTQPVGLVTVQQARAVSDEIERRWGVDHETPQVLIVRDGKVVWDVSHFRVKAEEIEAALLSAARP